MNPAEIVQQVIQEMDAELLLPQHRSLRQSVKIADWKTRLAALSSSPSESTRKPLQMPTDPEWYRKAAEREEANGDADCTVGSDAMFAPGVTGTSQKDEKRFPIQSERGAKPHPLLIPWSVAERAYSVYSARYGRSQSLERLAERGGFGPSEMDEYVPNWRDETSEITRLQGEVETLKAEAKQLRHVRDWTPTSVLELIDRENDYTARITAEARLAKAEATLKKASELTVKWRANADMLAEGNKGEWADPSVGMQQACANDLDQILALLPSAAVAPEKDGK